MASFHDEYRPFLGYTIQGMFEFGGIYSEGWLEKVLENILKVKDIVKLVLEKMRDDKRCVVMRVGLGSDMIAV